MSLTTKKRGQQDYLYDQTKSDGKMKTTYLGKVGDPKTEAAVKAFGEEAAKKKEAKKKAKKKSKIEVTPVFTGIPLAEDAEKSLDKAILGESPKPAHQFGNLSWGEKEATMSKKTPSENGGSGYKSPQERREKRDKTGLLF